ncbi:MAG: DNA polymerase I [Lachnospiraceae bacterium]|nr:DNA polymerase I [Lachnospiraceae bacterium]
MSKIVLIDGHSILNRAFFGVPDLTNSEGLHTNAIYGFLNILFKILDEETPDYLMVAFDVKAPTFRHQMYSEYKGTRKPMADELRQQVPVIKEVLQAMGIKIVELPGFEADDILGTVAKRSEKEGMDVSLVSGDRDLLQIATDKIKIRIPKTKGGKTQIEDYYSKDVVEKYQVDPITFIDLKALMGDTADNIPGVPKVGEKTATNLLVTYGSLDDIYEHLEEVKSKSIHETLKENRELAYLSKKLATIEIDAPVELDYSEAKVHDFYTDEAYKYFKRLEFKNMLGRFEKGVDYSEITGQFTLVEDYDRAAEVFESVLKAKEDVGLCVYINEETKDELIGISLSLNDSAWFIKKWMFISDDYLISMIQKLFASKVRINTYNLKDILKLTETDSVENINDIIIGAYLLNPLKNDYSVNDIGNEYLKLLVKEKSQYFGKDKLFAAVDKDIDSVCEYACFEAFICNKSGAIILEALKNANMLSLYNEIEMPLVPVLSSMEVEGIKVLPDKLAEFSEELGVKIDEIQTEIFKEAGTEFNINSPKQLGEVLFEKMNLPGGKKTKTGYSTAADVLEKLSAEYPVVKKILDYRAYAKLKSTYADGLVQYIDSNNRIHSTFNQTITATGRLSSTDPNLQNIPIRMDLGRQIRKVFVPKEDCIFIDADYSQIELRVLASVSGDEKLIKAYSEHADIHSVTASLVFHVPFEEVTPLLRRRAKAVNFGIVYGISAFGLGEDLGIDRKEAQKYIEDYFVTYPNIKTYLDSLIANAKEKGYVETVYGRRRPVPELASSNFMQRQFGERVAMNAPIQGTAADIIKIAMIRVYNRLKNEKLKSKLILQIHDELLIETYNDEKDIVESILRDEMINAAELAVKMEIDLNIGSNWYEAK